jgi:segregation and condensation protein B
MSAVDTPEGSSPSSTGGDDAVDALPAELDRDPAVAPREQPPLIEDLGPIERSAPASVELPPPPPIDALPPAELRPIVEALLFVAAKPLSPARLAACLPGVDEDYLDGFIRGLGERYDREKRGWTVAREAGGWRLLTRAEHHPWVRQLEKRELPQALTRGALETLAVIAYKQPVTRGVVEDIRGVQTSHVIAQLLDLKLIRVVGRDESVLGRPWLYGTTDQFLTRFGIGSIDDLPKRHEFGA